MGCRNEQHVNYINQNVNSFNFILWACGFQIHIPDTKQYKDEDNLSDVPFV